MGVTSWKAYYGSYAQELLSMRVELGLEKSELLGDLEVEQQLKFTSPPMRMEIRSILKSLEVKHTTPKLQTGSSKK